MDGLSSAKQWTLSPVTAGEPAERVEGTKTIRLECDAAADPTEVRHLLELDGVEAARARWKRRRQAGGSTTDDADARPAPRCPGCHAPYIFAKQSTVK